MPILGQLIVSRTSNYLAFELFNGEVVDDGTHGARSKNIALNGEDFIGSNGGSAHFIYYALDAGFLDIGYDQLGACLMEELADMITNCADALHCNNFTRQVIATVHLVN